MAAAATLGQPPMVGANIHAKSALPANTPDTLRLMMPRPNFQLLIVKIARTEAQL
jgi:hypothetical protein